MRKEKRGLGVDRNGVQKMMRKRDYLADMSGQFGMNLVANLIGQLTYFYTDKVSARCTCMAKGICRIC